jgi:hypothetical protein
VALSPVVRLVGVASRGKLIFDDLRQQSRRSRVRAWSASSRSDHRWLRSRPRSSHRCPGSLDSHPGESCILGKRRCRRYRPTFARHRALRCFAFWLPRLLRSCLFSPLPSSAAAFAADNRLGGEVEAPEGGISIWAMYPTIFTRFPWSASSF